jgi:hypothetical protein
LLRRLLLLLLAVARPTLPMGLLPVMVLPWLARLWRICTQWQISLCYAPE